MHSEPWLKEAALLWDNLYRITPCPGFQTQKPSLTEHKLQEECGFIIDEMARNLNPFASENLEEAASSLRLFCRHAQSHKDSPFRFLLESRERGFRPYFDWREFDAVKCGRSEQTLMDVARMGAGIKIEHNKSGTGISFDDQTGMVYMALLARSLAQSYKVNILTDDMRHADMLDLISRSIPKIQDTHEDEMKLEVLKLGGADEVWIDKEEERTAFGLCRIAFRSIGLRSIDDIPVSKIIKIRRKYADERHRYFSEISKLVSEISTLSAADALQDRISIIGTDIDQALADLRSALKAASIEGLLRWSCISLSFPLTQMLAQAIPEAKPYLFGAAVSMGVTGAIFKGRMVRKQLLQSTPWSYLHVIKSTLGAARHVSKHAI